MMTKDLLRLLASDYTEKWVNVCDTCGGWWCYPQHSIFCIKDCCLGHANRQYFSYLKTLSRAYDARHRSSYENRFVYRDTKAKLFHNYRMELRKPLKGSLEREYQFAVRMKEANQIVDDEVYKVLHRNDQPWFRKWIDDRTTWLDKRVATS